MKVGPADSYVRNAYPLPYAKLAGGGKRPAPKRKGDSIEISQEARILYEESLNAVPKP